jgi:predicted esterase/catechol 2,3-dioxygenase-like lactoylglutathione lyase family enzyme
VTSVLGIHHVTAIASDPQRNLDFYTGVLGMRLVKRTVNFDDPQTYHLYYGDEQGSPGTIMTFFPWPGARRGRQGVGQVAVTSFAVSPAALGFWVQRLLQHGVEYRGPSKQNVAGAREQTIAFTDPDGTMLEIVATDAADERPGRDAPGIQAEHSIRGFHGVTLWVADGAQTADVLTKTLGFRGVAELETAHRFEVAAGGPGAIVNVRSIGNFVSAAGGAGTVHHVAFAVPDDDTELRLREDVRTAGLDPTAVLDRNYFHSVYFREPGGVLYELATTLPGFAIDEPMEHLGEELRLPPQYEPRRAELEAVLPPIHTRVADLASTLLAGKGNGRETVSDDALGFVHRYVPPSQVGESPRATTLLMLHGTGGDEQDLIPLGRALVPGAALLSPRGKVLERGMPRFFRRIAEGVFDQQDLALRTEELGNFVEASARTYAIDREGIVAVGFSNGANIAASLLLRRPGVLPRAILLSPMVPFQPEHLPALEGTSVFIGAGRSDPIAPASQVEQLAEILRSSGADVTVHWEPGGHAITSAEVDAARRWIEHTR